MLLDKTSFDKFLPPKNIHLMLSNQQNWQMGIGRSVLDLLYSLLQVMVEAYRRDASSKDQLISELKASKKRLVAEVKDLKQELLKMEGEKKSAEQEQTRLQKEVERVQQQMNGLEAHLQSVQTERDQLDSQLQVHTDCITKIISAAENTPFCLF